MKKKLLIILAAIFSISSCQTTNNNSTNEESSVDDTIIENSSSLSTSSEIISSDEQTTSYEESSEDSTTSSEESSIDEPVRTPYVKEYVREARNVTPRSNVPTNTINEDSLPIAYKDSVVAIDNSYSMLSGDFRLDFPLVDGKYHLQLSYTEGGKEKATPSQLMFENLKPAKLYIRGTSNKTKQYEEEYTSITKKNYGILASCSITSDQGGIYTIEDRYYFPQIEEIGAFNVSRSIIVDKYVSNDKGYQSIYDIDTPTDVKSSDLEWFVPNSAFSDYGADAEYRVFRETLLGLPMAMFRNKNNGYTVSLARYQPDIDYQTNSFASIGIFKDKTSGGNVANSLEINYPTRDTARRYFSPLGVGQVVYDMTIRADKTDDFADATINSYTAQYNLEEVRIVDTDIDEVYKVVNEDFKSFFQTTTRNGYTTYGLPWRVTIENGLIGPKSWQAGFVGQQIPCAYNMMLYGIKNSDYTSYSNGMKIIDSWLNVGMMTLAGVPQIWYDGASNRWLGYPTFTRMAVDAMEGMLDAYRLASAHNVNKPDWIDAVTACADWLVSCQNSDGSWYRCYNYQGTYYKGTESDITWNPGNIAQSTSKQNTTMPLRFLGKMYELTNSYKYLNAILKAGDYIYQNIYPQMAYYGGTCDNPNIMDKEAGVFAMYAYDTLYTLTKDEKWLKPLKYATIFTMSSVISFSFSIPESASDLKAALSLKCGYTEGLSYIGCSGTALDNYAAYMYYELFRIYIYTNDKVYLDMADFIQQDTKSTMDWDGMLNYPYKSLTPEASTIYSFGYASAKDDNDVMGVWLPWQSAANAEPIAKMYDIFNDADVHNFASYSHDELLNILENAGVGGKTHRVFKNTIL